VNVINVHKFISRIQLSPQLLLSPMAKIWIGCVGCVWMRSVR